MKRLSRRLTSVTFLSFILHASAQPFSQRDEPPYLQHLNTILGASYAAVNDEKNPYVPPNLLPTCAKGNAPSPPPQPKSVTVSSTSNVISASEVASQCSSIDICIIPSDLTLVMDTSLHIAALKVYGTVRWNDDSMGDKENIFLCAGYVAIEGREALWDMDLQTKRGWIYIQDNNLEHELLRTRAFGAMYGGIIDIKGQELERTWSLLSRPVEVGDTQIHLLHNPALMGWNVGDRIAIAPTEKGSIGYSQEFRIVDISKDGILEVDAAAQYASKANFQAYKDGNVKNASRNVATMSAEVVNLSRNIVITGDDFTLEDAIDGLPEAVPGEQTSAQGCLKTSWRSKCTYGLHTAQFYEGMLRMQNIRVEKCGQRGVAGKYCFHFHKMRDCPNCLLKNNVAEFGQQRGVIVHGTHNVVVEDNIMYNVRGANLYIEDGNEMYNKIRHNIVICPFPFQHPQIGGCTIPGTSNHIADTSDNQSAFYSRAATNDMVGNRAVNTFNGMFLQALGMGRGIENNGKVCEADARLGRFEGNVFHGHTRFGTYTLGSNYPKLTDQSLANNGQNVDLELCTGFDESGMTRGIPATFHDHLDYDSVFVGHYSAGDFQYQGHYSSHNNNLMYWKETKNMEDGCSAHIIGGHYQSGNMALPDQATFVIEDTSFKDAELEANHHCTVGITGVLCMPQYLMHNVKFEKAGGRWLWFQSYVREDHTYTQPQGGIFSLSPPDAAIVMEGGKLEKSIFPEGFVSVVSSLFTYLLRHPSGVCVRSSDVSTDLMIRYSNGILCKVPLRSLKVYSRNQLARDNPPDLRVQAWFGSNGSNPDATQNLRYHQSGPDNIAHKQGYSIPVIPGVVNKYRLSLANGQNVPNDWIIEFNDPVVGNRWEAELITLEVQGRTCTRNGEVSSQHDRRFIWSGDEFLAPGLWDRNGNAVHGACVAAGEQPPNMPTKNCAPSSEPIGTGFTSMQNGDEPEPTQCPELCFPKCNENSYCDCGTAKCLCKTGFTGQACSVDLCAAARCGINGTCTARYLGTGTTGSLPVTSNNACICESGFSGILCDRNPCKDITCSGNGHCIAQGLDAKCICDDGYSGDNCKTSCDLFCSGTFPYKCNPNLGPEIVKYGCHRNGRDCAYLKDGEEYGNPNDWCTFKEKDTGNYCDCSTTNQCQVIGSCNDDGTCPEPILVDDGTPCNSIPWGICENGKCVAAENPCEEDKSAKFLVKIKDTDTGEVPVLRKCAWLSSVPTIKRRRQICNQTESFGDHKPAKDVCHITCEKCVPCEENELAKFYVKTIVRDEQEIVVKRNCAWLSKRPESRQQKLCLRKKGRKSIPPAKDVCVVTCDTCGWKE